MTSNQLGPPENPGVCESFTLASVPLNRTTWRTPGHAASCAAGSVSSKRPTFCTSGVPLPPSSPASPPPSSPLLPSSPPLSLLPGCVPSSPASSPTFGGLSPLVDEVFEVH